MFAWFTTIFPAPNTVAGTMYIHNKYLFNE